MQAMRAIEPTYNEPQPVEAGGVDGARQLIARLLRMGTMFGQDKQSENPSYKGSIIHTVTADKDVRSPESLPFTGASASLAGTSGVREYGFRSGPQRLVHDTRKHGTEMMTPEQFAMARMQKLAQHNLTNQSLDMPTDGGDTQGMLAHFRSINHQAQMQKAVRAGQMTRQR